LDKNKIIEAAAKLVAKGAYDKAIKEYQKVLEADPKDVRILQKMGELYQKKNDNVQAAQFFTRVAESYTNDGFFLKAVALYKQVLKLDSSLMDVNLKLAELHQQLQLLGEAMGYYQIVANHWDKQGDPRRSLDVLRKMVDLDPDNVASRRKLADLYVREGLNAEAAVELEKAVEHHRKTGRGEDYQRDAERLSSLQPDNLQLARELAEYYLQKSDQKRALAKLQICFKADNRDIDTLRLLAVAFEGLGQMSKTISVYKELARAYEDKNFRDEADQVWQQVAKLDPDDADVQARNAPVATPAPVFAAPPARATASAPAPHRAPVAEAPRAAPAAGMVVAAAPSAKPKNDALGKLLTETDVYVKYGLHDKALEHLRKVFAVDPENIDAHEKAYSIYVASNNHAQSFEQLLNVLRLHTRSGDGLRAQPYLATILAQNPNHPEVPVFVSALGGEVSTIEPEGELEAPGDDAILVDSSDDEVIVADEPEEGASAELALGGDDEGVVESAEVLSVDEPSLTTDDALLSEADAEVAGQFEVEPPPVADELGEPQVVSDFEAEVQSTATVEEQDESLWLGTSSSERATSELPAYEPEPGGPSEEVSVPQYIPLQTEPGLPYALGSDQTDTPTGPTPTEPTFEAPRYDEPTGPSGAAMEATVEAPPEDEPAGEECDEATFFVEQGLYDEAREILETVLIAYPEHRRAAELMARVEAETGGAALSTEAPRGTGNEGKDAFDLAAELANELGGFGDDEGAADVSGEQSAGGDQYQVSVEEVFAEFKKGLEKVVKPEDVDTHYDLGVAYKEMGLTEDAIGEFSIARKGCLGKRKEIDCLSMIGMLQLSRGEMNAAIDVYQQGLASDHAHGDVEKSLRYELATAFEAAAQNGKALGQYLKVQTLDGAYRDVAAHVERLSAVAVAEEDGPSSAGGTKSNAPRGGSGARKVGYV
jgi:pilus assembly protein FimV